MSFFQAILLGIVQGLTEFLPVSSSGHLAICEQLFHIQMDSGMFFDVMLHLGTLIAIFVAFRKDIGRLIMEAIRMVRDIFLNAKLYFHNKKTGEAKRYTRIVHSNYRRFVVLVLVATIPTAILGYFMRSIVDMASATLLFPGLGLLVTGILLLVVDFVPAGDRIPRDVNFITALLIGVCQGFATFPGVSRSGTTITACLLGGFNRKFAVKFSFIMSIPAVLGAAILEWTKAGGETITAGLVGNCFAGAIAAGIVGYFSIKTMLVIVQRQKLRYFSYYCFLIGVVAIVGNFLIK